MKFFTFLLLFFSCDFIDQDHFEIDPNLRRYVDKFYIEANARGYNIQHQNLIVRFGSLGNKLWGQSDHNSTIPTVTISSDNFEYLNESIVEYVVFHELGHALLYRDHSENYSIMTKDNKHVDDYNRGINRKELIDELFCQCPTL